VKTVENTYYKQEGIIEETIEQIIKDTNIDSSSSSSEGCSDQSESGSS
jgi:hypothetical protein